MKMRIQNPAPSATNPVEDGRVQPESPASGEVQERGVYTSSEWRAETLAYLSGFSPSYPECRTWGIDHLLATVRHTNPALWAKARDAGFWERA